MFKRKSSRARRNLKKFRSAKFNYAKFVRHYYIENGSAYISAKVNSIDDIVSRYSLDRYEWINSEFAEYIENSAYYIPVEESIIIEICGQKFSDKEKETIRRVIKDYFGLKLGDKIIDLDINRNKSNRLLLLGILSVGLVFLASRLTNSEYLLELPLIMMWFFIWEYGDLAWLDRWNLDAARLDAGQLANAKIIFNENEC
jgi:hypothetical protein